MSLLRPKRTAVLDEQIAPSIEQPAFGYESEDTEDQQDQSPSPEMVAEEDAPAQYSAPIAIPEYRGSRGSRRRPNSGVGGSPEFSTGGEDAQDRWNEIQKNWLKVDLDKARQQEREQAAQQRQAQRDAIREQKRQDRIAKAEDKDARETMGQDIQIDHATGQWTQKKDLSGKPLFVPDTSDVSYDEKTGKPFQMQRDKFGSIKRVDADANVPIGRHETQTPDDPFIYRQRKNTDWEAIDPEQGMNSPDERVKVASAKELFRRDLIGIDEERMNLASQLQAAPRKLTDAKLAELAAQRDMLSKLPPEEAPQPGWMGFGGETQEGRNERLERSEQRRAQIDQLDATLAEQQSVMGLQAKNDELAMRKQQLAKGGLGGFVQQWQIRQAGKARQMTPAEKQAASEDLNASAEDLTAERVDIEQQAANLQAHASQGMTAAQIVEHNEAVASLTARNEEFNAKAEALDQGAEEMRKVEQSDVAVAIRNQEFERQDRATRFEEMRKNKDFVPVADKMSAWDTEYQRRREDIEQRYPEGDPNTGKLRQVAVSALDKQAEAKQKEFDSDLQLAGAKLQTRFDKARGAMMLDREIEVNDARLLRDWSDKTTVAYGGLTGSAGFDTPDLPDGAQRSQADYEEMKVAKENARKEAKAAKDAMFADSTPEERQQIEAEASEWSKVMKDEQDVAVVQGMPVFSRSVQKSPEKAREVIARLQGEGKIDQAQAGAAVQALEKAEAATRQVQLEFVQKLPSYADKRGQGKTDDEILKEYSDDRNSAFSIVGDFFKGIGTGAKGQFQMEYDGQRVRQAISAGDTPESRQVAFELIEQIIKKQQENADPFANEFSTTAGQTLGQPVAQIAQQSAADNAVRGASLLLAAITRSPQVAKAGMTAAPFVGVAASAYGNANVYGLDYFQTVVQDYLKTANVKSVAELTPEQQKELYKEATDAFQASQLPSVTEMVEPTMFLKLPKAVRTKMVGRVLDGALNTGAELFQEVFTNEWKEAYMRQNSSGHEAGPGNDLAQISAMGVGLSFLGGAKVLKDTYSARKAAARAAQNPPGQPPAASNVPPAAGATPQVDPERIKTASWLNRATQTRLAELQTKRDGVKAAPSGFDDNGNPVFDQLDQPGKPLFGPDKDELDFLESNPTPEQVAEKYGYTIKPPTEASGVTTPGFDPAAGNIAYSEGDTAEVLESKLEQLRQAIPNAKDEEASALKMAEQDIARILSDRAPVTPERIAAAQAEITDTELADMDPPTAQNERLAALGAVKLATGQPLASLTSDEQAALKSKTGDGRARMDTVNGVPILTNGQLEAMGSFFPEARKLIKTDEETARQGVLQGGESNGKNDPKQTGTKNGQKTDEKNGQGQVLLGQWTARGRDGTTVTIPLSEAANQSQAQEKLALALAEKRKAEGLDPRGELLDLDSVESQFIGKPAETGESTTSSSSTAQGPKNAQTEAVQSLSPQERMRTGTFVWRALSGKRSDPELPSITSDLEQRGLIEKVNGLYFPTALGNSLLSEEDGAKYASERELATLPVGTTVRVPDYAGDSFSDGTIQIVGPPKPDESGNTPPEERQLVYPALAGSGRYFGIRTGQISEVVSKPQQGSVDEAGNQVQPMPNGTGTTQPDSAEGAGSGLGGGSQARPGDVAASPVSPDPLQRTGEVGGQTRGRGQAVQRIGEPAVSRLESDRVAFAEDSSKPTQAAPDDEGNIVVNINPGQAASEANPTDPTGSKYDERSFDEELKHVYGLLHLRRKWETAGRKGTFNEFVKAESDRMAADITTALGKAKGQQRKEAERAMVAAWNLYHEEATSEQPTITTSQGVMDAIASGKKGGGNFQFLQEWARQLRQLQEDGKITEQTLRDFLVRIVKWLDGSLREARQFAVAIRGGGTALEGTGFARMLRQMEAQERFIKKGSTSLSSEDRAELDGLRQQQQMEADRRRQQQAQLSAERAAAGQIAQEVPEGQRGSAGYVLAANKQQIPAAYVALDDAQVVASHDGITFSKNPEYPGENTRAYDDPASGEADKVARNASNYIADLDLSNTPSADSGPPVIARVIREDGTSVYAVVGGNSRRMMRDRLTPDQRAALDQATANAAPGLGFATSPSPGQGIYRLVGTFDFRQSGQREAFQAAVAATNAQETKAQGQSREAQIAASTTIPAESLAGVAFHGEPQAAQDWIASQVASGALNANKLDYLTRPGAEAEAQSFVDRVLASQALKMPALEAYLSSEQARKQAGMTELATAAIPALVAIRSKDGDSIADATSRTIANAVDYLARGNVTTLPAALRQSAAQLEMGEGAETSRILAEAVAGKIVTNAAGAIDAKASGLALSDFFDAITRGVALLDGQPDMFGDRRTVENVIRDAAGAEQPALKARTSAKTRVKRMIFLQRKAESERSLTPMEAWELEMLERAEGQQFMPFASTPNFALEGEQSSVQDADENPYAFRPSAQSVNAVRSLGILGAMQQARTADEGRKLWSALDAELNRLAQAAGVPPITGQIRERVYVGLSGTAPKARLTFAKAVERQAGKDLANQVRTLLADAKKAEAVWNQLYDQELNENYGRAKPTAEQAPTTANLAQMMLFARKSGISMSQDMNEQLAFFATKARQAGYANPESIEVEVILQWGADWRNSHPWNRSDQEAVKSTPARRKAAVDVLKAQRFSLQARASAIPAAQLETKAVERYQWMLNAEGDQSYGNREIIVPVDEQIFQKDEKPLLRKGYAKTSRDYRAKHPEQTHVSYIWRDGDDQWQINRFGSLESLRPAPMDRRWAKQVEDFDSPEARQHGNTADNSLPARRSQSTDAAEPDLFAFAASNYANAVAASGVTDPDLVQAAAQKDLGPAASQSPQVQSAIAATAQGDLFGGLTQPSPQAIITSDENAGSTTDQKPPGQADSGEQSVTGNRSETDATASNGESRGEPGQYIAGGERASRPDRQPELRQRPTDPTKRNHVIENVDDVAPKSDGAKWDANVEAIELLRSLDSEQRSPSLEERKVLARYTGWGWAKEAFNQDNPRWQERYTKLRELLGEDEFMSARKSSLNAHFTDLAVIDAMWGAARRLGFNGGNVLEPAAGVGHFFGRMPSDMVDRSRMFGVELDTITGNIMRYLYPETEVQIAGFQEAGIPNNSVDLAISNVPFGNYKVAGGRDYPDLLIHDYFFARALDKVRPGGLVMFITSDGTMDKSDKSVRQLLSSKADLVGAIRLPNNAFKANAGTEVTTDIIILRKKDSSQFVGDPWLVRNHVGTAQVKQPDGTNKEQDIWVNEYYAAHPEMALGRHTLAGTMYSSGDYALVAPEGQNTMIRLASAVMNLPENAAQQEQGNATPTEAGKLAGEGSKEGSYVKTDTGFYQVVDKRLEPADWLKQKNYGDTEHFSDPIDPKTLEARKQIAAAWIGLRNATVALVNAEVDTSIDTSRLGALREALNRQYDKYVQQFGTLTKRYRHTEKAAFLEDDPEYSLMQALENEIRVVMPDGKDKLSWSKADIFRKRIREPRARPNKVETIDEAVNTAMSFDGKITTEAVAALLNITPDEAKNRIIESGRAFENPETGLLESREKYLSGRVRDKLAKAEAAAAENPLYKMNVEALNQSLPKDIPLGQIYFRLASRWIPGRVTSAFASQLLGSKTNVEYSRELNKFIVRSENYITPENTEKYGTKDLTGYDLLVHALNGTKPDITRRVGYGENATTEKDIPATQEARRKLKLIEQEFVRWVKTTTETMDGKAVQEVVAEVYNQTQNAIVAPNYTGDYLVLDPSNQKKPEHRIPGLTNVVWMNGHRRSVVARILQEGCAMMAHGVGTGKTFAQIVAAMEMRRLGMARKPMIVVQKATIGQFAASVRQAYPSARILVATEKTFEAKNRQRFMSRIATGDYDMVIVTQPQFDKLLPGEQVIRRYFNERIADLENAKRKLAASERNRTGKRGRRGGTNDIETAIERLRAKMQKMLDGLSDRADAMLSFEQLGVDALFIDEAHAYKKAQFVTNMRNVKGLPNGESQRAMGLEMKAQFIQERNNGRNVILATGTPVTNTIAEAYIMLRLATPHVLEAYNIHNFDDFAHTYAEETSDLEYTWGGKWKMVSRFKRLKNGQELVAMIRSGFDVKMGSRALGLNIPDQLGDPGPDGKPKDEPLYRVVGQTPIMETITDWIVSIADKYEEVMKTGNKDEKFAAQAVPIVTMQAGMAAALDPRLVDPSAEDHPDSKVNTAIKEIIRIHNERADRKGTQIVFADRFAPMNVTLLEDFVDGKSVKLDISDSEDSDTTEDSEGEKRGGSEKADAESEAYKTAKFNLYRDIRDKLVAAGIPANHIAIIHDYKTDAKRAVLYDAVNQGAVRILIGSTEKLGVGVNVQNRLAAIHHLDPPRMLTPAMLEQRIGRVIRQGNRFSPSQKPDDGNWGEGIYNIMYAVERSMDTGIFQMLENKGRFIAQLLSGQGVGREFEDAADEITRAMSTIKAIATGDQRVLRMAELRQKLAELTSEREGFENAKSDTAMKLAAFGRQIQEWNTSRKPRLEADAAIFAANFPKDGPTTLEIDGKQFTQKDDVASQLRQLHMQLFQSARDNGDFAASRRVQLNGIPIELRVETLPDGNMSGGFANIYSPTSSSGTWLERRLAVYRKSAWNTPEGLPSTVRGMARDFPSMVKELTEETENWVSRSAAMESEMTATWDNQPEYDRVEKELRGIESALMAKTEKKTDAESAQDAGSETPLLARSSAKVSNDNMQGYLAFTRIPAEKQQAARMSVQTMEQTDSTPYARPQEEVGNDELRKARVAQGKAYRALLGGDSKTVAEAIKNGVPLSRLMLGHITREPQSFNIVGAIIDSPLDLAAHALAHRTPFFESLKVVVVDKNNQVIASQIVSVGTVGEALVGAREVYAVIQKARRDFPNKKPVGYLISHNHPSGDPYPSDPDHAITRTLDKGEKVAGIPMIDHVITNGENFFSYRESGMLSTMKTRYDNAPKTKLRAQLIPTPQTEIRPGQMAEWEAVPSSIAPKMSGPNEVYKIAGVLQTADPGMVHVLNLNTRHGLISVDRHPLNTAPEVMMRTSLEQGTRAIAVSFPDGLDVNNAKTRDYVRSIEAAASVASMYVVDVAGKSDGANISYKESAFLESAPEYVIDQNNVKLTARGIQNVPVSLQARKSYHGTPKTFDKFDSEKVGTGEGGQAYGWGLYFAENPSVAQKYAKDIARRQNSNQTNVYTVRLEVAADKLVDWDKPLSEQNKTIQKAFGYRSDKDGNAFIKDADGKEWQAGKTQTNASMAYWLLGAPEEASKHLLEQGIAGIRYFDEGSRTSNAIAWKKYDGDRIPNAGWRTKIGVAAYPNEDRYAFIYPTNNGYEAYFEQQTPGEIEDISMGVHETLDDAKAAVQEAFGLTYNYVVFDESKISITHRNGSQMSAGEVLQSRVSQKLTNTQKTIDERAERRDTSLGERNNRQPSEETGGESPALQADAGQAGAEPADIQSGAVSGRLEDGRGTAGSPRDNERVLNKLTLDQRGREARIAEAFGDDWPDGFDALGVPNLPKGITDPADPRLQETSEKTTATIVAGSLANRLLGIPAGEVSRQKLRTEIIKYFMRGGNDRKVLSDVQEPQSQDNPLAVFMGGGGAAGKTSLLNREIAKDNIPDEGRVLSNADEVREFLPEYDVLNSLNDARSSVITHEEASMLADEIQRKARQNSFPLVIDGTMKNSEKSLTQARTLRAEGYRTKMIAVTIDPYEALVRSFLRAIRSKRYVPPDVLLGAHKGFNAALRAYIEFFGDDLVIYDNSPQNPILLSADDILSGRFSEVGARAGLNENAATPEELLGSYGEADRIERNILRARQSKDQMLMSFGNKVPTGSEALEALDNDTTDAEYLYHQTFADRLWSNPEQIVKTPDFATVKSQGAPVLSPAEAKATVESWKKAARDEGREKRGTRAEKVVLSLFDDSGMLSQPWEDAGYTVYRLDIHPESLVAWKVNVMDLTAEFLVDNGLDMVDVVLAQPPCTDFASSGARWFAGKDASGQTEASVELIRQTLAAIEWLKPKTWALENPIGRIKRLTGLPEARLVFDPFHYGDTYTKRTQIWGEFNSDLPTALVEPTEGSKIHKLRGDNPEDKRERSLTPEGFAYAFWMANRNYDADFAQRVAAHAEQEGRSILKSRTSRLLMPGVLPDELAEVIKSTRNLKKHPEFFEAKRGNTKAAFDIVKRVLKTESVEKVKSQLKGDRPVMFLPVVHSDPGPRPNALPIAYARELQERLGGSVATNIAKIQGTPNTDATELDRANNVQRFAGNVDTTVQYVVVDDTVTSGDTLISLLEHLITSGAKVSAVTTLADGRWQNRLRPSKKDLAVMLDRAGLTLDTFSKAYGIPWTQLTGGEVFNFAYLKGNWKGREKLRSFIFAAASDATTERARSSAQDLQGKLVQPSLFARTSRLLVPYYRGDSTASTEQPGVGVFLTPSKSEAAEYARGRFAELGGEPRVSSVVPSLKNPVDINAARAMWSEATDGSAFNMRGGKGVELRKFLQGRGFDGIADGKHLIVFDPKSVAAQQPAPMPVQEKAAAVSSFAQAFRLARKSGMASYASGVATNVDAAAVLSSGVPLGTAVTYLKSNAILRKTIANAVGDDYPVFVDSGAFTAFTKNRAIDFDQVFRIYGELASKGGKNLSVVAPDKLNDQMASVALVKEHAHHIAELIAQGVRVILPVQFGKMSIAEYLKAVGLTRDQVAIGLPANKAAYPYSRIRAELKAAGAKDVHYLGMSGNNRSAQMLVDAALESGAENVTMDANRIRSHAGQAIKANATDSDEFAADLEELAGNSYDELHMLTDKQKRSLVAFAGLPWSSVANRTWNDAILMMDSLLPGATEKWLQKELELGKFSRQNKRQKDIIAALKSDNFSLAATNQPSLFARTSQRGQTPAEAINETLREVEGRIPMDLVEKYRQQALTEAEGQFQTGRPDLAFGASDAVTRAVDESRKRTAVKVTNDNLNAEARAMLAADREGVKRRLLEASMDPDLNGNLNDIETRAAAILRVELIRQATSTNDQQALKEAQILTWAYRETGTQQARALGLARRDPHKKRADRHRDFLMDLLFSPDPKVEANFRASRPAATKSAQIEVLKTKLAKAKEQNNRNEIAALTESLRRERDAYATMLNDANAEWRKKVEGLIDGMGITMDDLFSDRAELRLKGRTYVKEAVSGLNDRQRRAMQLLMDGVSVNRIRKMTGLTSPQLDEVVTEINRQLDEKLGTLGDAALDIDNFDLTALFAAASRKQTLTPQERAARIAQIKRAMGIPPNISTYEKQQRTFNKRRKKAKDSVIGGFDINKPEHVIAVSDAVSMAKGGRWVDYVREAFINNILSAPMTAMANATGYGYTVYQMTIQRALEATFNKALRKPGQAEFDEFSIVFNGIKGRAARAWELAVRAWDTENSPFAAEFLNETLSTRNPAIPDQQNYRHFIPGKTGRIMRMPTRMLLAMDTFSRTLAATSEVGAVALRLGKANGKAGQSLQDFVTAQVNTPGSASWQAAAELASEWTFTNRLRSEKQGAGFLEDKVKRLSDAVGRPRESVHGQLGELVGTMFLPFITTPFRLAQAGLRKTWVGSGFNAVRLLSSLRLDDKGRLSVPSWTDGQKLSLMADGFAAALVFGLLFHATEGDDDDEDKWLLFTGTRPAREATRGERESAMRTVPPQTIRIGGRNGGQFSYSRLDPFSTIIATTVDTIRQIKAMGQGRPAEDAIAALQGHLIAQVEDKTFMRGMADLGMLMEGTRSMPEWAMRQLASVLVPNILRNPMRALDPMVRDTKTEPFSKETIAYTFLPQPLMAPPAKRDLMGREVRKGGNALTRALVPGQPESARPWHSLDRFLSNYNRTNPTERYAPQSPPATYKDPLTGKTVDMTARKYSEFMGLRGRLQEQNLFSLQAQLSAKRPTIDDKEAVRSALMKSTKQAREMMFGRPIGDILAGSN